MGDEGARGRRRDRRRRPRRRPARSSATRRTPSFLGGSLGERTPTRSSACCELAGRAGAPVVGFIESGGARMQEGLAALGGYGRIFREHVALSGRVPQISVICGASAGGGSYSPALTDFVVMTERAAMFLTGPGVVREVMGEDVGAAELGGPKVHDRNGVAPPRRATDEPTPRCSSRDLLDHLPASSRRAPAALALRRARPATTRPTAVPTDERRVYDVRDVVARHRRRRPHARVGAALGAQHRLRLRAPRRPRRSASSPTSRATSAACSTPTRRRRARASCAPATRSGSRCVVLVDTPGFMPGTRRSRAA